MAPVVITSYHCGSHAQRWIQDYKGRIVNFHSGKCLEAGGNSGGIWSPIFLYDCHEGQWQKRDVLYNNDWGRRTATCIRNRFHAEYLIGKSFCGRSSEDWTVNLRPYDNTGSCRWAQSWTGSTGSCV